MQQSWKWPNNSWVLMVMKREKAETRGEGRWPPRGERSSELRRHSQAIRGWGRAEHSGGCQPCCILKTTDAQTPLKIHSSEALKVSLKAPRWLKCEPGTDSQGPWGWGKEKGWVQPSSINQDLGDCKERESQFTLEQIPYGSGVGERMSRDRSLSCSPTKKKTAL